MEIEFRFKIDALKNPIIHRFAFGRHNQEVILKKINNILQAAFDLLQIKGEILIDWNIIVRDDKRILTEFRMEDTYSNTRAFMESFIQFIMTSDLLEEDSPKLVGTLMDDLKDFIIETFPEEEFSLEDLLASYEIERSRSIDKGRISTYLSRLTEREFLIRNGKKFNFRYSLNMNKPVAALKPIETKEYAKDYNLQKNNLEATLSMSGKINN